MQLIVIHKNKVCQTKGGASLLRFALSSEVLCGFLLEGLENRFRLSAGRVRLVMPRQWAGKPVENNKLIMYYDGNIPLDLKGIGTNRAEPYFIISDGRFIAGAGGTNIAEILAELQADVVTVTVDWELAAYREKAQINAKGQLAGLRRLYSDETQYVPVPNDWPHHIFIKNNVLNKLAVNGTLPLLFSELTERCRGNSLPICSVRIGGTVLDLETREGMLNFLKAGAETTGMNHRGRLNATAGFMSASPNGSKISETARLLGKVVLGNNVRIGPDAIVAGPAILGDDVEVGRGAIVRNSIIGSGIHLPNNCFIQDSVPIGPHHNHKQALQIGSGHISISGNRERIGSNESACGFRMWPRFSYPGCLKRIADMVIAILVIVLFAPVLAVVALGVKLSSPGPVFFRDRRQGLHGREFNCLKFRSMIHGADKIQEKLRSKNQVDGPQFKIEDDPRVSPVGEFLRDTYIDEIPQFFNVLAGQMSVVGPRPSPKAENSLCPFWRDARLSVRPGITGLWQVCRTREPSKDFQEWVYYDTKYVGELSLRLDVWICLRTTKKLMRNFLSRF